MRTRLPQGWWDRHGAAHRLGITYPTLRVYEAALGGVLAPHLKKGPNRTVLVSVKGMEVLATAVQLRREGWPFKKLSDLWKDGTPEVALSTLRLQRSQGKRIQDLEASLRDVYCRLYRLEKLLGVKGQ